MRKRMAKVAISVLAVGIVSSGFALSTNTKSVDTSAKTNAILQSIEKQLVDLNQQIADMDRQMHTLTQIEANR